jgi:hypothetical protein
MPFPDPGQQAYQRMQQDNFLRFMRQGSQGGGRGGGCGGCLVFVVLVVIGLAVLHAKDPGLYHQVVTQARDLFHHAADAVGS